VAILREMHYNGHITKLFDPKHKWKILNFTMYFNLLRMSAEILIYHKDRTHFRINFSFRLTVLMRTVTDQMQNVQMCTHHCLGMLHLVKS